MISKSNIELEQYRTVEPKNVFPPYSDQQTILAPLIKNLKLCSKLRHVLSMKYYNVFDIFGLLRNYIHGSIQGCSKDAFPQF